MPLNAYLSLSGVVHGDVKGSVTQKGREGKILVIAADHEVLSPRDAATGQATGRRMHKPFRIVKLVDKATPVLYSMLSTNERTSQWELQFWRANAVRGTGAEVQYYTVRLTNAAITDIAFHMPNTQNPDTVKYAEYEEVSFTYQKIEWIWTNGNISTQDDWNLPALSARRAKSKAKRVR